MKTDTSITTSESALHFSMIMITANWYVKQKSGIYLITCYYHGTVPAHEHIRYKQFGKYFQEIYHKKRFVPVWHLCRMIYFKISLLSFLRMELFFYYFIISFANPNNTTRRNHITWIALMSLTKIM